MQYLHFEVAPVPFNISRMLVLSQKIFNLIFASFSVQVKIPATKAK